MFSSPVDITSNNHQNGFKPSHHHHDSKLSQLSNVNHNKNSISHINSEHNQNGATSSSGNNNNAANSNGSTNSNSGMNAASSNGASGGGGSSGSGSGSYNNGNQHNSENNHHNNYNNANNNSNEDDEDNDDEDDDSSSSSRSSSYSTKLKQSQRVFSSGQKDILRLIGQHLRYLGLDKTTELLVKESGCMLEHPTAASFCGLIMSGKWDDVRFEQDFILLLFLLIYTNHTFPHTFLV